MAMDVVGFIMNIAIKAVLIALIITGIIILVKKFISKEKRELYDWKFNTIPVVCILIVIDSWIVNMGWIRFIFAIPMFFHAIAFLLINILCSRYNKTSQTMKIINICVCITYVLANVMLPDGGDVGGMYTFFGLIRDDIGLEVCGAISSLSFTANIILMVCQIVIAHKEKKKLKVNEGI